MSLAKAALVLVMLVPVWVVCAPNSARAQRVLHRVAINDSYRSIARHYYGTRAHAWVLKKINGNKPEAGRHIRVPSAYVFIPSRTRSIRWLARTLLGSTRRYTVLQAFNPQLRFRAKKGQQVLVPFTISHDVGANDTFKKIARRYYGTMARWKLVAEYNLASGSAPASGSTIEIPVGRIRIRESLLREITNQRVLGVQRSESSEQRRELRFVNALLREAKYWRVPLRLVAYLSRQLPQDGQVAEMFRMLAVAYVAMNRQTEAVEAFRQALLRQPSLRLDPMRDSPKVIKALALARQQLEKR